MIRILLFNDFVIQIFQNEDDTCNKLENKPGEDDFRENFPVNHTHNFVQVRVICPLYCDTIWNGVCIVLIALNRPGQNLSHSCANFLTLFG